MCFNEYVSLSTFVIGTIFNVLLITIIKTKEAYTLALIWQWVLLMQLFEALIWINKKKKKKNNTIKDIGTSGAYIANILQPLVIYLSILLLTNQNTYYNVILGILVAVYIGYLIMKQITVISKKDITVDNGDSCNHLYYKWWDDINPLYYIILIVLLMAFAKPHKIFIPQIIYILLILLVVSVTKLKCSIASTWCFLAAFAPLLTLLYLKNIKN